MSSAKASFSHLSFLVVSLALLSLAAPTRAWLSSFITHPRKSPVRTFTQHSATSPTRIAVPASELDAELTKDERNVVSVVRRCGPAVAYVTSVQPFPELVETTSGRGRNRRRRNRRRSSEQEKARVADNTVLPKGQPLGSGSGFLVSSDGYIVTNYHVIEAAYQRIAATETLETMVDDLVSNVTALLPFNASVLALKWRSTLNDTVGDLPKVYVRISSDTNYQECRIVNVKEDLDIAVLKIVNSMDNNTLSGEGTAVNNNIVTFGSSSDLLVGQSLVAIGNPFGLDNSVTTGVVSALNRDLDFDALGGGRRGRGRGPSRPLRNCIQTDAAINPGNSGGPLLNLKGEVVGVNTAIVSTSGSNAGIGFAVPSDQVQPCVDKIILNDRMTSVTSGATGRGQGYIGVSIVEQQVQPSTLASGTNASLPLLSQKNWISKVFPGSPAVRAGIQALRILDTGTVVYGDAIVALGGNSVSNFVGLQEDLKSRAVGENVAVTLENAQGERRVVYLQLEARP